jgi:hypothetical protein
MVTQRSAIGVFCTSVVATAVAAATVAGCSAEPEKTTETLRPLTAKGQASSIVAVGKGYRVNWAVLVANPNRWHFGENVVATVVGRDAQGKEVVRQREPMDAVPPGRTMAFSGTVTAARQPVKMEIDVRSPQWRKAIRIPSAFKQFPLTDVQTVKLRDGQYLVSGYVIDPFRKPASTLRVTALLHDGDGRLLGGRSDFVDDVSAGGRQRFVITVPGVAGAVAPERTKLFVSPWGSTAGPYEELVKAGLVPLHTVKPKTEPFPKDRNAQVSSFE